MILKSTRILALADERFATTRCLTKHKPDLGNKPIDKVQTCLFSDSNAIGRIEGGIRCLGYYKLAVEDKPLISVVTVVFNGEKYLEQAINSVIMQSYDAVEYIIIDGASNDSTLDIIRKYNDKIDYWVSEPDKGISDAMNKGIKFATGEHVIFIHADDYLENNNCIKNAIKYLKFHDIVLGDILFGKDHSYLTPRGFNYWINFKTGVFHQAAFCRKQIFKEIGGFNTDLQVAMDYDFFLRAYRYGYKARKIGFLISVMRDTGISSKTDWQALLQRFNEEKEVQKLNNDSFFLKLLNKLFWKIYLPYRQARYCIMVFLNDY